MDTWMRTLERRKPWEWMTNNVFNEWRRAVRRWIDTGRIQVVVAAPLEHEGVIWGWVAYAPEEQCIGFTFVREKKRGQSIGTQLLDAARAELELWGQKMDYIVHTSHMTRELVAKWGVRYRPWAMMKLEECNGR